ncbi:MAG TPA: hypothetical protein VJ835_05270 [Fimbriimonadaceae bacterium]|nr:hypothetical protein [Fimbriimonadaceae bacterium]
MTIPFAVVADHASADSSGKLNLLGVFERITVQRFPSIHKRLYLVFRISCPVNEANRQFELTLKFLDQDGREEFKIGPLKSKVPDVRPDGAPIEIPMILELENLQLIKEGRHEWKIEVDGDTKAQIPITISVKGQEKLDV